MKILNIFKSRTVLIIIVLFIINGISGIREFIPGLWLPMIDGGLSLLAIYFRINQRVNFKDKREQ